MVISSHLRSVSAGISSLIVQLREVPSIKGTITVPDSTRLNWSLDQIRRCDNCYDLIRSDLTQFNWRERFQALGNILSVFPLSCKRFHSTRSIPTRPDSTQLHASQRLVDWLVSVSGVITAPDTTQPDSTQS